MVNLLLLVVVAHQPRDLVLKIGDLRSRGAGSRINMGPAAAGRVSGGLGRGGHPVVGAILWGERSCCQATNVRVGANVLVGRRVSCCPSTCAVGQSSALLTTLHDYMTT